MHFNPIIGKPIRTIIPTNKIIKVGLSFYVGEVLKSSSFYVGDERVFLDEKDCKDFVFDMHTEALKLYLRYISNSFVNMAKEKALTNDAKK